MRSLLMAGILCAVLPLAAQNPPAPVPQLEKPPGAAAEEPARKAPAAAKEPAAAPVRSQVVEEIIARVNNEIITRSELEKARAAAEEDARQECSGRCSDQQLRTAIEERQKNSLR